MRSPTVQVKHWVRKRRPSEELQIVVLLVAVALLSLGYGLQATLVSMRAGIEGMSEEVIGFMMSAFYVGFVVASVYGPRLVHSAGHIRAFAAFASLASATALAFILVIDPVAWTLLRAVHGACYALLLLVAESWLNTATSRRRRGRVLATYGLVLWGAWAAGQPLLKLAPVESFHLFVLVSISLSVALVPITLTRTGEPGSVTASRPKPRRLYQISPLSLIGVFVTGTLVGAFFSMGPRFGQMVGLEDGDVAGFIGAALVGAIVMQWPLGWLSDVLDRRVVIIGTGIASGLVSLAIAMNSGAGHHILQLMSFALGAFALPLYSICVARMNDGIPGEEVVTVASGLILVFGIGSAFGPFSASLLMGRIGPSGLFWFTGVLMLAYGLFAFIDAFALMGTRKIADKRKKSFVAVPQTSHTSMSMHEHSANKAENVKHQAES
jgi:MFS family permease